MIENCNFEYNLCVDIENGTVFNVKKHFDLFSCLSPQAMNNEYDTLCVKFYIFAYICNRELNIVVCELKMQLRNLKRQKNGNRLFNQPFKQLLESTNLRI